MARVWASGRTRTAPTELFQWLSKHFQAEATASGTQAESESHAIPKRVTLWPRISLSAHRPTAPYCQALAPDRAAQHERLRRDRLDSMLMP